MVGGFKLDDLTDVLKRKLTFDEMITHLNEKGITFEIITQDNAKDILQNLNYLFKLTSYRKNFHKNNKNKYVNLDFGMLSDLATIDMRLRYIVLQMTLDLEHRIKTNIMTDITNNQDENGYDIVNEFFDKKNINVDDILKPLKHHTHYNYGLYSKYGHLPPVWVLFEIISFGQFVRFVEFYYEHKNKSNDFKMLYKSLKYAKNIRNCAAHNTPILMDITHTKQLRHREYFINEFVREIPNISNDTRNKRLSNRKVHDLTALLILYNHFITSKPMKEVRYEDLTELIKNRAIRHENYYSKHSAIISVYKYFYKIIDYLNDNM